MIKTLTLAVLALLTESSEARHHHHHNHELVSLQGIDKKELMSGAHWRKSWPEGVDDGDDDDLVMHLKGKGRKWKKPDPVLKYEWNLDPEVVDSAKHLEDVESAMSQKLSAEGYQDRGRAILNSGDRAIKSPYL